MPKLTLPQILALARAAGHELGGPTADGAGIVAQLRAELAEAKRERNEARERMATIEREHDTSADENRVRAVQLQGQRFALQGELSEARAQIAALERTVAKLRSGVTRGGAAEASMLQETAPTVQEAPGSTIDPSKVLLARFAGAQGYGTADKLKALGARWTWDPKKPGEPRSTSGAWRVPASPEALALLEALRADGRTLTVSA